MATGEKTLADTVCQTKVTISNANGLHMRPAMLFVDVASQFKCEIKVSNATISVDGKSIMQMTMLAATPGAKLKITAQGDDAAEAVAALKELVEDKQFEE